MGSPSPFTEKRVPDSCRRVYKGMVGPDSARGGGGGTITNRRRDTMQEMRTEYWRKNLRLMAVLLTIWAVVSYGCGILFVDVLNTIRVAGFPLGFWFAQQGSIYVFVALIFVYVWRMRKLDRDYDVHE